MRSAACLRPRGLFISSIGHCTIRPVRAWISAVAIAWPSRAAEGHVREAVAMGDMVPREGLGFDLIQITPGRYLPESVKIAMRIARTAGDTYGHPDLTAATVNIELLVPDRGIDVEGGTLASGERDSRGRREVVYDETVAPTLRSLIDHIAFCEEHGWRVDSHFPRQPEAVPRQDRTLKRINQRMRPDWMDQNERIVNAANVAALAREERKSATRAVAGELFVSERLANELIREAKDAGYLPEDRGILG
ncbi:hypothetical protein [Saccharopolyspora shandongensis]|uniref:hypothetical protein n=1 Tax=Saccharopolyspora shandongensis TaxID=418495 RepID=UPI0033EC0975